MILVSPVMVLHTPVMVKNEMNGLTHVLANILDFFFSDGMNLVADLCSRCMGFVGIRCRASKPTITLSPLHIIKLHQHHPFF